MESIIETERIILRRFLRTDFEAVYAFNSDLEVMKYTGDVVVASLGKARAMITEIWETDYSTYGYGRWAAVYKETNEVIGFAGLKYLPELEETDIGFRFLPEYWNKGIATEVSKEIIKYGFEQLGLDRIIGIAMAENIGSQRVLEKIGLTFYKTDEYDGDGGAHRWYEINMQDYKSNF